MNIASIHQPDRIGPEQVSNQLHESVARKLETAFIAEVLKTISPKASDSSFSGGIGEEQFQSFLNDQHAHALMKSGGFGLSDMFVKSLSEVRS